MPLISTRLLLALLCVQLLPVAAAISVTIYGDTLPLTHRSSRTRLSLLCTV